MSLQSNLQQGWRESLNQQILFDGETRGPNDVCESFLTNEMNKTKLNDFMIWNLVLIHGNINTALQMV